MKKIVILDTWTNNTNLGNKIISEAVYKVLREIFPKEFFYRVPALEYLHAGRIKIKDADYVFLAGTNLLSSNMDKTSHWCVHPEEEFWMNKVILLGLGWWQYQSKDPNLYTRSLLNKILNLEYLHSFRDSYTNKKMQDLGFKGLNTGCPTMWKLTEKHCSLIPQKKSNNVVLTFTEYNQTPKYDQILFKILERNYSTVYFWPQMYIDYFYAKQICGSKKVVFIDPSLEALDEVLRNQDVDYVGTRLYAGIRALQHQRRSIIVAIDNRCLEMGRDFNLPFITREEIEENLDRKINDEWKTSVKIDINSIETWKQQFDSSINLKNDRKPKKVVPGIKNFNQVAFNKPIYDNADLALVRQALEKLNQKNDNQALTLLQEAIISGQGSPGLYYGKAVALARLGRSNEAVNCLNHLLAVTPGHKKGNFLLKELRPGSVGELMEKANQALDDNQIDRAFNLLIQAKSLKQPVIGLDYLRAICFIKMNRLSDAFQALLEELRHFPKNMEAKNLKAQIQTQYPTVAVVDAKVDNPEFRDLFKAISPYTMLGEARLYSLFSLAKRICLENIPGNIVECGVAAGGSTALMAAVIKRYSKQPRCLYAFDSFEGMPPPTEADQAGGILADLTGWGTGTCAAPEGSTKEICSKLGVENIVRTIKGYFEDTLPKMHNFVGMIALLHMDGDWYESTKTILENLYDRISNNGLIQVDDYGHWEGCRQAVHEFEANRQLKFNLNQIDYTGVWFSNPNKFPTNLVLDSSLVSEFVEDDPVGYGINSQMSSNERFQLYYVLRKLLPSCPFPLRFVEIGSFAGSSLFLTCRALRRITSELEGFAIEPGLQPQFARILQDFKSDVTHLRMFSGQATSQVERVFAEDGNRPLFIFVDGDHTYEGVREDIINYFPILAPGGIMMFHDYLPPLDRENRDAILFHHGGKEPGIRQACQELMEDSYGCEVLDIPLLYPTDPTQTQAFLPIISGVFSTIRVYRKPSN